MTSPAITSDVAELRHNQKRSRDIINDLSLSVSPSSRILHEASSQVVGQSVVLLRVLRQRFLAELTGCAADVPSSLLSGEDMPTAPSAGVVDPWQNARSGVLEASHVPVISLVSPDLVRVPGARGVRLSSDVSLLSMQEAP